MPQHNPYLSLLEIPPGYLNIMDYRDEPEGNGSGCRAVVWLQGTLRECPGSTKPQSWSFEINQLISVDQLATKILSNPRNQGVTFSGGEPFWQAPALVQLARKLKSEGLSVMAFTSFTLEELRSPYGPAGAVDLMEELDILSFGDMGK